MHFAECLLRYNAYKGGFGEPFAATSGDTYTGAIGILDTIVVFLKILLVGFVAVATGA